jgi:hypothetical protein
VNAAWKPWLPPGALAGGAVERVLAEAARRWSDHWFPGRAVFVLGGSQSLQPADPAFEEVGQRTRLLGEDLALLFGEGSRIAVAGLMLDSRIEARTLTPADRDVLHDLADRCLDDLGTHLAAAFGCPPWRDWRPADAAALPFDDAQVFALAVTGDAPLLRLAVSTELVVTLVKKASSPPAAPPLRPLGVGLARQEVVLSAMVGRSALTLQELAALAPGDVLVLDRAVGEPATLAVDGALKDLRAAIEDVGGQLRLKILKSLSEGHP